MIKKSIYSLILVLLFTGCAELGENIHPTAVKKDLIVENNISSINVESQQTTFFMPDREPESITLDETTKNNIAGVLVMIIGIMILL